MNMIIARSDFRISDSIGANPEIMSNVYSSVWILPQAVDEATGHRLQLKMPAREASRGQMTEAVQALLQAL